MWEPWQFALAALALLLTPGPTNTLLGTGGALAGARRALPLVAAELLGYICAISALQLLVGPLYEQLGQLRFGLRLISAVYLAFLAFHLWGRGQPAETRTITFAKVFTATLVNPKAMVFAFIIIPCSWNDPRFGLYAAILAGLIAGAGTAWVLAGGLLYRNGGQRAAKIVRRVSSLAMASFSAIVLTGVAIR